MKIDLFRAVLLTLALAAAGCTNKDIDGPDDTAPTGGNIPPVADAGADQTVAAGDTVTLAGAGSDADGSVASYNWSQASGPSVTLNTSGEGVASFTAPAVEEPQTLVFDLRVTDNGGATSGADSVTVSVLPKLEKFFGTATDSDNDYLQLLTYFDQVTPGNAGKWGSVESTRDVMDWTKLDSAHTFAQDHGLRYKHHTLIWGQQQPGWLEGLEPEEQLAEIEEWMAALKAKYANNGDVLDMIDVVNEPLHAPPAYKEALGGDGESGWDWVIKAFELARKHFPHSKLILNDYNILQLEVFTKEYLEVIEPLQKRGLIDGIGVQGHFLEQSPAGEVKKNLDLLAATGLPIYVSELDINFADDARQANVMRDLFSVFWQHPAVAGVTHWGYRQGFMWRPEAWLLNSDDTERPALQWLNCYMAGEEHCDTLVPEYIPGGWAGNEYGLTLQAEHYDQGQGVVASGDVVAYTDAGDWIAFQSVEFQQGWDRFSLQYAKGSGAAGYIDIRLDCEDLGTCNNVIRVNLPGSGSWSSFRTLDVAWPEQAAATRDVYVRFGGASSVGNIDWIRFGTAEEEPQEVNLVADGDFEGNTLDSGWSLWWSGDGSNAMALSGNQSKAGTQSLRVFNRDNANRNPSYNLTGKVEPGKSYAVSAWVYHTGAAAVPVKLSAKLDACPKEGGSGDTYPNIEENLAVPANEWTQLSGTLEIPAECTLSEARIYFEGTPLDVEEIYIDDVKVLGEAPEPEPTPEPGADLVADGGFEGSSLDSGWGLWWSGDGSNTIALSGNQSKAGTQSLRVSNRDNADRNPSYNLTSKVEAGKSYAVSAWVYHTGAGAVPVKLSAKLDACPKEGGSGDTYPNVEENLEVPANEWTQLSGTLEIPAECTLSEARIYFEGTPLDVEEIYIDEVSVTEQ